MKKQLVAVYGSLKKGFGNHGRLTGARFVGKTLTEPKYTMRSLGGFPGVTLKGNTPIHIEVYEVDEQIKKGLDMLESHYGKGNPRNFYDAVDIPTEFGEATMYVLDEEQYDDCPVVEGGCWEKLSYR